MSIVRYAQFRMLDAVIYHAGAPVPALRTAHRASFTQPVRPGYLYVRSRAISSRTNDNFDTFPAQEIAAGWRTFLGKPVFVNHHNESVARMRGVIIDAALHEDVNPDGTPDTWVEVLMEVDAQRFPRLAKAIINGDIERTSMGCNVAYSVCSFCGNRAETPLDYCAHVARMKGRRIHRTTASGARESVLVSEVCYGLAFFENSLLVEEPADPTAVTLGVDARGLQPVAALATLDAEALGPRYPDPAQHPWFQANPVHPDNIVDHWRRATPEDKEQGSRWYGDANIVAKAIAGGDTHKGAGVLAAYSPQALWPVNMFNAARSLAGGKALGGKGSGVFATASMADQAQRIMDGGRHEQVLKGPKIQDFAHLIEHGGDADPTQPRAVIDRHALAVAVGRRLTDEESDGVPIASRHYYGHVVDVYRQAAQKISDLEGRPVAPHQVQAATWLVRQRENAQDDHATGEPQDIGRERGRQNAQRNWSDYAGEHYPSLAGPGYHTGHRKVAHRRVGYGEQVAPPAVDTLRDEACPVCGDRDSFNGQRCQVCGYVTPPEQLQDPDLQAARDADDGDPDLPDDQDDDQDRGDGTDRPPQDDDTGTATTRQPAPPLSFGSGRRPDRRTGVDGMGKPHNRAGTAARRTAAPAERNRLLAALASQQHQIAGQQARIDQLGAALAVLVDLAGAGTHPVLATLPRRADVEGGAPLPGAPSPAEPPAEPSADEREYQEGYAEGGQAAEGAPDLASPTALASWASRSDPWKIGWADAFEARTGIGRTAADEVGDPVATTSDQALTPAATDDPTKAGGAPAGANKEVTPGAATTPGDTDVSLSTEPYNKLVDVTQPVPGANNNVPTPGASHVPYDIDAGTPSTAVPFGETGWKSSSADPRARLIASLRLAKLRRAAGVSDEDELALTQQIESSEVSDEGIAVETATLASVLRQRQAQTQPGQQHGLVPRAAGSTGVRRVPSLADATAARAPGLAAGLSTEEFGDLP